METITETITKQNVRRTIEQFHMLPKGATVVVGVSGGADSMALLHILVSLNKEYHWKLEVVHVHHGLRGAEADRDCVFVESFCGQLGLPCHVFAFDLQWEAKKRGLGLEETGRLLRYESFRKVARGAALIAVAHHQGDQGETLLMRLCRGTGLLGLGGMRPVQGEVVRPLLFETRADIEAYCHSHSLSYCNDSTNATNEYTRNRIRHQLMPLLEELYPKATAHLAQTASFLAEDEDYMQEQALLAYTKACLMDGTERIAFSATEMQQLPQALKKRVWRLALAKVGLTSVISSKHLLALGVFEERQTGKTLALPQGFLVKKEYDVMILEKKAEQTEGFGYVLPIGEEIFVKEGNFFVKTWVSSEKNVENADGTYTNVWDYDKMKNSLFCRTRKEGDYFLLPHGRKKLKAYFIDEKIPRQERDRQPLIACGNEVLWVIGKRKSTAYGVDEGTKQYLVMGIRKGTEETEQ